VIAKKRLNRAVEELQAIDNQLVTYQLPPDAPQYAQYRDDPVGYFTHVLHVTVTPDQAAIAEGLLEYPHRVKARAGHSVGKSFIAAAIVNWWFDTRDPSVVITTAPTLRDVVDILWTEVRLQRQRAGLSMPFAGPSAPHMKTSPEHWAKGITANKSTGFQGRHRPNMLFVFDEDEGIAPHHWHIAGTMFSSDGTNAWLAIGNPTTTTSESYNQEQAVDRDGNPKWALFTLSCLNHPNIDDAINGRLLGIPTAVNVEQIDSYVADWCDEIDPKDAQPTDIEWPRHSGRWYRPGPLFESRVLGRRPSSSDGVWSEALWEACTRSLVSCSLDDFPEIGCDVARFGPDYTCIVVRVGPEVMSHEEHNGWGTDQTAGQLKFLARQWCDWQTARYHPNAAPCDVKKIAIKVDDAGVGGGVVDQMKDFHCIGINAQNRAADKERYPNERSESWFAVAERARKGRLSLRHLLKDRNKLGLLRRQALAPSWKPNAAGQRVVEPKEDTKKKLGRSPDGMDALNLAFSRRGSIGKPTAPVAPPAPIAAPGMKPPVPTAEDWAKRRGLFGM
jgi:hypothetical protein